MSKLHVLHLANCFSINELYANLIDNLESLLVENRVICFSSRPPSASNKVRREYSYPVNFQYIKKPWHRFLYYQKIQKFKNICCEVISDKLPDLIHAHTLYSDGAIAYEMKCRFNIPYVVAIRNSDINTFAKLRPDLSSYRDKILLESSAIILISPAYKEKLRMVVKLKTWSKINDKIKVIPNGIDDIWHCQVKEQSPEIGAVNKLLYVGDFSKNKNVHGLLAAFSSLSSSLNSSLTIVGGGGDWHKKIEGLIKRYRHKNISYLGIVSDKKILREIYRSHHLLVIPSFHETFGLAYVEALSQGVPCVHSVGEGIDGYFVDGVVSIGCNPHDTADIESKIQQMLPYSAEKYAACVEAAADFRWSNVARKYLEIYRDSFG